jgi:hypothetical protein
MTNEISKSFLDVPSEDGLIALDMRVLLKLLNTERRLRLEALQERLATALDIPRGEETEDDEWEDQQDNA